MNYARKWVCKDSSENVAKGKVQIAFSKVLLARRSSLSSAYNDKLKSLCTTVFVKTFFNRYRSSKFDIVKKWWKSDELLNSFPSL